MVQIQNLHPTELKAYLALLSELIITKSEQLVFFEKNQFTFFGNLIGDLSSAQPPSAEAQIVMTDYVDKMNQIKKDKQQELIDLTKKAQKVKEVIENIS